MDSQTSPASLPSSPPAGSGSVAGNPPAAASLSPGPSAPPVMVEVRDHFRETLETIAFVVCLVLLLKAFVAEAYVIPTGSMATTLYGDHSDIVCERCRFSFTINNKTGGMDFRDLGARCQNCQYVNSLRRPPVDGGDKVLVLRPQYDFKPPQRYDTIVFKFPGEPRYLPDNPLALDGGKRLGGPQEDFSPRNFIKRLWGLPGEKLAIWEGDIYRVEPDGQGGERLEILRRPPDLMLSMRRLVNDNDFLQPLARPPLISRWRPDDDLRGRKSLPWSASDLERTFTSPPNPGNADFHWLRYLHIIQPGQTPRGLGGEAPVETTEDPQLITDHLAYNEGAMPLNWCRDLMVEAEIEILEPRGELAIELNAGCEAQRLFLDLGSGQARLNVFRSGKELKIQAEPKRVSLPGAGGRFVVRFANFDRRLTVWVDDALPFGAGVDLPPLPVADRGPRLADLSPVSLGVKGGRVAARRLRVWRDIYYTRGTMPSDVSDFNHGVANITLSRDAQRRLLQRELQALPDPWSGDLPKAEAALYLTRPPEFAAYYPQSVKVGEMTGRMPGPKFYPVVHPQHHPSDRFGPDEYFALGDNSPQSKDSRYWGQIPERLLLGKAVWVYWPPSRFGPIR